MKKIDIIYWINLRKATERKKIFEKEILPIFENYNIQMFEAIDMTSERTSGRRTAGCSLSHLSCWRHAIFNNYKNIMILEDDLKITIEKKDLFNIIDNLFNYYENFNICNLAYNHKGQKSPDKKLMHNFYNYDNIQTTSAYIANVNFLKSIYNHMVESTMNLFLNGSTELYAIDTAWKVFQNDEKWICSEKIGYQRESFSEIEQKYVDYKV